MRESKYSNVFLIPSFIETLGIHPNDFNLLLLTTKFPTSTFYVYLGVLTNLTLEDEKFSRAVPNL